MSLILDALNRSRQDSEQLPGLDSYHPVDNSSAGSGGSASWVQWLLVSGLALAVLVIGWLLFDRTPPAVTVLERSATVLAPASAQADRLAQSSVSGRQQIAQPVTLEGAAPSPQETAVVAAVEPLPAAQAPSPSRPAKPAVDASVAALYRQQEEAAMPQPIATRVVEKEAPQEVSKPDRSDEEAIDIELLVAKAQAELADARLQDNGVPFLATLSQQTKDAIPTLMYQRHDYSGNQAESSVLINGKTLRSGASVAGVKVQEILPDSVVLDFKGTQFRLRALNSWVNL